MKNLVWDNDIVAMHDHIENNLEDYGLDADASDETVWGIAHEEVENRFGDEQMNLSNVTVDGTIILTGKLQRWNGGFTVFKDLETCRLSEALEKAVLAFGSGDNDFEIYCDNGDLWIRQLGHDNPVTPSLFRFRTLTNEDAELIDMEKDTISIAPPVNKVYGWD